MKFTVKRSEWLRGDGNEVSRLLAGSGKRCCVGFVANQCGASDESIFNQDTLGSAVEHGALPEPFVVNNFGTIPTETYYDRTWIHSAYNINDDPAIADSDRESKLSKLFADNGHELAFID